MQKNFSVATKIFIFVAVFAICFGFLTFSVYAESYSLYVDGSFDGDSDGSEKKPYNSLKKAIEESKAGDKIFINKGNYKGNFTVLDSISLYGESKNNVIIEGPMIVSNGFYAENISFFGGYTTITVKANASAKFENCVVRNSIKMGINILPGSGSLVVKNSTFRNNGKGFYVEAGNHLEITDSVVYKNREEGIDIRNNVNGIISGNEIYENGESGLEVILGKSDLKIKNNIIRSNSASGIATQYYSKFGDKGNVKISENKLRKNEHYGIKCGVPQGGDGLSKSYWGKSMTLGKNIFSDNGLGEIQKGCKIMTEEALAEEEKKKLLAELEQQEVEQKLSKQEEDQLKLAQEQEREEEGMERQKEMEDENSAIREESGMIENSFYATFSEMESRISEINSKNKFSYFFSGPDSVNVEEFGRLALENNDRLFRLKELFNQSVIEDTKKMLEEKISIIEPIISEKMVFWETKKADLVFWNRVKNIFRYSQGL